MNMHTYPDGVIYVPYKSRWGRINMQREPIQFPKNEVMITRLQDETPPFGVTKGHTIVMGFEWLKFCDHFHSDAARRWGWTPYFDIINRGFVGDAIGSLLADGADPAPVAECITTPLNTKRIIGETATHYELWAFPNNLDPRKLDHRVVNPGNMPYAFSESLARTATYEVQLVGNGLNVWKPCIRNANKRLYIPKEFITVFQEPPFIVHYKNIAYEILDYLLYNQTHVDGITADGTRIPLVSGRDIFHTEWRCSPGIIPASRLIYQ